MPCLSLAARDSSHSKDLDRLLHFARARVPEIAFTPSVLYIIVCRVCRYAQQSVPENAWTAAFHCHIYIKHGSNECGEGGLLLKKMFIRDDWCCSSGRFLSVPEWSTQRRTKIPAKEKAEKEYMACAPTRVVSHPVIKKYDTYTSIQSKKSERRIPPPH